MEAPPPLGRPLWVPPLLEWPYGEPPHLGGPLEAPPALKEPLGALPHLRKAPGGAVALERPLGALPLLKRPLESAAAPVSSPRGASASGRALEGATVLGSASGVPPPVEGPLGEPPFLGWPPHLVQQPTSIEAY
ncbi:repetitive proline-rich cell wall protein 2-like [Homarus americanus]|uniref:repetitive proline-rich cell wall protein 2-like n=1 Tax=Homarus americanus TaxID=6706 RepID=UPI001C4702F1|nr:repetitive proline-rich cell wall protein 2-like [Homarus americanus]